MKETVEHQEEKVQNPETKPSSDPHVLEEASTAQVVHVEDKAKVKQRIHELEAKIEAIQLANTKVANGALAGIPKEAIADDVSEAGLSIEEQKKEIQKLKESIATDSHKHWWQKAVVVGGMFLTGLFATKEASGQNTLGSETRQEKTVGTNEYDSVYYTPGSPKFNPLKVFQDLSLEFHPDRIDSAGTGMSGGKPHPLRIEMDKVNHVTVQSLQEDLFPQEYTDFESFRDAFIKKRTVYFSNPKVFQESHLHDAYYKGKSIYYRGLLEKYKGDFEKFKRDRPKEAVYDFNDFNAGLMYNRSQDIDYTDEKAFKEVIENWTDHTHDDIERVWDFDYQKDHLEEEAKARWDEYQKDTQEDEKKAYDSNGFIKS